MSRHLPTLGALAISVAFTRSVYRSRRKKRRQCASQAGDLAEMRHQLELGADPNQAYALFAAVKVISSRSLTTCLRTERIPMRGPGSTCVFPWAPPTARCMWPRAKAIARFCSI